MKGFGRMDGYARGRGRMPGGRGEGPNGRCVCPSCGYTISHTIGQPCNQRKCPKCNTPMTRQ